MTDSLSACPTPDQIKSLIDGALPASEQSAIQSHLDDCATCQQVLESLVQGSESWDSAIGHLRRPSAVPGETVLSDAMKQMKAEEFDPSADVGATSRKPLDFLSPSDQPGSIGKLGMYEVTEVVGQGGMGIVLKAFDPALHRVVAVKVLAPYLAHNPQARKRFVREAQAIAAVSHDHVITIYAIDESAEQPKIVMQYVSGRSLQQKIDQEGSLDLKEILRIGMQTAAGLAAAHTQGLVHRDVKPSNILLENGIQRVKLTDFGLARAVDDASLTQSGAIAGTPQYMAPEQANGDAVDYRADLFSLGSVMYAMCVGHSPFRASTTMGVLKRVCHDAPRPIQELNADIPEWLCAIVMKLLAKDPNDRFQSAKSVADLLEKWLAHVQQPMVVARPASVSSHSAASTGERPKAFHGASTEPVSAHEDRVARRQLDARTIFFQPISGRWFLFFVLLGMAGMLATVRMDSGSIGRPNVFELLMITLMAGLFTGFWGLVIVAIVRFVWANLYGYVPWVAKTAATADGPDEIENSGEQNQLRTKRIWPENIAVLSGIMMMLLSFNPLFAAIGAIIVWRVMLWRTNHVASLTDGSARPAGLGDLSGIDIETGRRVGVNNEPVSGLFRGLLGQAMGLAKEVYVHCTWERFRLPMAIGWFLTGGIDLMIATQVNRGLPFALFISSGVMFLLSFAASYSIQSRQNFHFLKWVSYAGLLPVSFGALVRIPLSIVTLFWLHSTGTRESFASTPFLETGPGRLVQGGSRLARRLIGTAGLAFLWTLGWLMFSAFVFWMIVLPYGPSSYEVYDKSRVTFKDQPDNQFLLISRGWGSGTGLIPPSSHSFRPQQVTVEILPPTGSRTLNIRLGETLPINLSAHQWLTGDEVEGFLNSLDGKIHTAHAQDLFHVIERLNAKPAEVLPLAIPFSERMRICVEMWNRHYVTGGPPLSEAWAGFSPLATRLNPQLFEIRPDHDMSRFDCYPATWLLTILITFAVFVWLLGSAMIIRRRHFTATKSVSVPMALAV